VAAYGVFNQVRGEAQEGSSRMNKRLELAKEAAQQAALEAQESERVYEAAKEEFELIKARNRVAKQQAKWALDDVKRILKEIGGQEARFQPHIEHQKPAMKSRLYPHCVRSHKSHEYNCPDLTSADNDYI